eukprot:5413206-Amphidinium_carterae.1
MCSEGGGRSNNISLCRERERQSETSEKKLRDADAQNNIPRIQKHHPKQYFDTMRLLSYTSLQSIFETTRPPMGEMARCKFAESSPCLCATLATHHAATTSSINLSLLTHHLHTASVQASTGSDALLHDRPWEPSF